MVNYGFLYEPHCIIIFLFILLGSLRGKGQWNEDEGTLLVFLCYESRCNSVRVIYC